MRAGEARLSIDCGTATTKAVLAWPDGSSVPLSFDGLVELPSAVYVSADGEVWTGQHARQAAAREPTRLVPSPRRPADDDLTVEGVAVEALELGPVSKSVTATH
ncbi:hypothetical protein [Micromonospora globbae]|uniref:hypothetical protein n=1 Tax=Micromonospora globbae TaxID=1894969 RepID=UPI003418927B